MFSRDLLSCSFSNEKKESFFGIFAFADSVSDGLLNIVFSSLFFNCFVVGEMGVERMSF